MSNSRQRNIDKIIASRKKQKLDLTSQQLTKGILEHDIQSLSRTITLLESTQHEDQKIAQEVLRNVLPNSGKSIRIGVTGVPGVGKSTFIESFGNLIIENGHKVAVLAIDPSSERSGGSILGDKTRMETLSTHPHAFIRPSSAGGSLGGVARKSNEAILLCEAAGFDVILIETVGVGQSETTVRKMCDFFLLLMLAGAGDELQGIKRGIMEMADGLLITKADGDNITAAKKAANSYKMAMHLFPPLSNQWTPEVATISAQENNGLNVVWEMIVRFKKLVSENGWLLENRQAQQEFWLKHTFESNLLETYYRNSNWKSTFKKCAEDVKKGKLTPYQAADKLIRFTSEVDPES